MSGRRLPFGFEVVGFAEEEGQRYKAAFLGSGALTGHFDPAWLDQTRRRRRHDAPGDASTPGAVHRRHPQARARRLEVPRLRRGAHRAGPGAERARPAAGHRHLDQRQRALPGRDRRHGQPRRHDADGPPPRRRHRGRRTGALRREARCGGARPGGHGRHARSSQRVDQRRARAAASSASTSAPPPTRCATPVPPTCAPSCSASAIGEACTSRSRKRMRAAGRAERSGLAAALGARRARPWPAAVPHCPAAPATMR